MAIGDLVESSKGERFRVTENGLVPVESTNPLQAAALSLGGSADRIVTNVGEMTGLMSPESIADRRATNAEFQGQMESTNPVSSFIGRNLTEVPAMMAPVGRVGGAVLGAAEGIMQPADDWGQRLGNAAIGAGMSVAGGVLGEGVSSMAGRVSRSIGAMTPMVSRVAGEAAERTDDAVTPLAKLADELGFQLSPAQRSGLPFLQRTEVGLSRNPLTARPFDEMRQANQTRMAEIAANAAGIPQEMLAETGGRITPEILQFASQTIGEGYEKLASQIPDITVPDSLKNAILKNSDIKKIVAGSEDLFQRLDTDGVISGNEYAKLRSALMKQAASEKNGDVAAMIAGQAKRLDGLVDDAIPDGLSVDFPRMREQWQMLDLLQRPNVMNADGGVNAGILNNRLRSTLGNRYTQELVDSMQPETAQLMKAAKLTQSPDFKPIVGSSGTGEAMAASDMLEDVMGAMQGDKGAIASILAKGKLGEFYMDVASRHPKALAELLQGNPAGLQRAAGGVGGAVGREQQEGM